MLGVTVGAKVMIMNNIYSFASCDYAKDFECLVDVHNYLDCIPEDTYDLWLKAYDTSCCENEREKELHEQGYAFECHLWIRHCYDGRQVMIYIEPQEARTKEEAERILINMAEDTMNDDGIVKTLKDIL